MDLLAGWARTRQKLVRYREQARRTALRLRRVEHQASMGNVYHCCVQRTGSQWIRSIFADPLLYRYSGLMPYQYWLTMPNSTDPRSYFEKRFSEPFPTKTVATPLYVDFAGFETIPKPERYAAFFVARDPRDIVVSSYFSLRHSHGLSATVLEERRILTELTQTDGLIHILERFERVGLFAALRSWVEAGPADQRVRLFRFEDLTNQDAAFSEFRTLFDHCGIAIPDSDLHLLLKRYSFEQMAGRPQGEQDINSHYRRGVAGDWQEYFDDTVAAAFSEVTGDLTAALGYE